MRDLWLVIKHDVAATIRQRSFWLLTLLMPVLLVGLNAYLMLQDSGQLGRDSNAQETQEPGAEPAESVVIGLVDEAGLVVNVPAGLNPDLFVRFPDETAARAALEAGEIEQYVAIPADYVATGRITVYDKEFQMFQGEAGGGIAFVGDQDWVLRALIDYNLTGDAQLLAALRSPIPPALVQSHAIRPTEERGAEDLALARVVASIMPYIYYFLLIMGGNYLMRSVVLEKESHTVEMLLLSLPPRNLLIGKMLAMSLVMMIQVVVWVGGGILILNRGADLMNVASFAFPPGFWIWAALFLVLGYLLYASVMVASGAIAQTVREGSQVMWLLIIPLMPTLMFSSLFLEEPDGALSVALSLFPLSAPSAMVTRLAVAEVPFWQILVSLAGLAITTYLVVVLAGRIFQAGNLLSGASFNWRRLLTGWRKPEAQPLPTE